MVLETHKWYEKRHFEQGGTLGGVTVLFPSSEASLYTRDGLCQSTSPVVRLRQTAWHTTSHRTARDAQKPSRLYESLRWAIHRKFSRDASRGVVKKHPQEARVGGAIGTSSPRFRDASWKVWCGRPSLHQ